MQVHGTGVCRPLLGLLALAGLTACASSGTGVKPPPTPLEILRGWQVYVYATGDTLVGRTGLPQHPADREKPQEILASVSGAFCSPVLDEAGAARADERLRNFCRSSKNREGGARVVLSPGWDDPAPPHPTCFIRCVCEGYAPRLEDPVDQARESSTGGCTNRLNCRVECPQD